MIWFIHFKLTERKSKNLPCFSTDSGLHHLPPFSFPYRFFPLYFQISSFWNIPRMVVFPVHILPLLFLSLANSSLIWFTYNVSFFPFSSLVFLLGFSLWANVFICLPAPHSSKAGTQGNSIITLGAIFYSMPPEQEHRIFPVVFVLLYYSLWLVLHGISCLAY